MKKCNGHSLIELLISLAIGLFLFGGILTLQGVMQSQYAKNKEALDKTIDTAWMIALLRDSIRRAGFTPCMPLGALQTTIQPFVIEPNRLTVNRMEAIYHRVMVLESGLLRYARKDGDAARISPEDPYILSDCYHAEVVSIASVTKEEITLQAPLQYRYTPPIYLGHLLRESFFIHQGLMYQSGSHAIESLSKEITALHAKVYSEKGRFFIAFELGDIPIKTRIRAA